MSELSEALNMRGLAFLSKSNLPRATEFFQAAVADDPAMADAYTNLGVAQFMSGHFTDAVTTLLRSDSLRPDHPETLLNLGYGLWRLADMRGAIEAFQRAVHVGDLPLAHIALGSVYWEVGNEELAITHCRYGLQYEPTSVLAHDTLREIYHYRGVEADALAACDAMIKLLPDAPTHAHKKAMVMLTYDDPAGWEAHECRYDALDGLPKIAGENATWFSKLFGRRWDGRPVDHLVVATEQGYGDVIQFLRFLPRAAERCTRLSLHVPDTLHKLVSQSFDIAHMEIAPDFPDEFDAYCLILSLGYLLGPSIPAQPYLRAANNKYDEVRTLPGFKVGVAWAGSRTMPDDRWRSMPFEIMARLLDLPAHFISLQFPCEIDLRTSPITVVHPTKTLLSGKMSIEWSETAALIAALDLVITVDTAVAHVAGAMGKPVWLLNRYNTDWRWGLGRTDTPWYPAMRIFRQPRMSEWESVIKVVYGELADLLSRSARP